MIDLAHTRFIISAWPDHCWPCELVLWLEGLLKDIEVRADYRFSLRKKNIVCARNTAILEGALQSDSHYQWFVFVDKDVRPTDRTSRFLDLTTDVKCCMVEQRSPEAWAWPDDFHDALWCTSRRVLEGIRPPWMTFRYNETGTEMNGCMCQTFQRKVLDSGFTISHGGWAEHDRDGSWC